MDSNGFMNKLVKRLIVSMKRMPIEKMFIVKIGNTVVRILRLFN
jgi:hypothetical protein